MKFKNNELRDLLVAHNIITKERFDEIAKIAQQNNKSPLELLFAKKIINEHDFAKLYASFIKTDFVDLSKENLSRNILGKLPERVARRYMAIVFGDEKDNIKVAMADPEDIEATQFIEKQLGYSIRIYLATTSDINAALELYKEGLDTEISKAIKETEEEISIDKEELDKDTTSDYVEEIIQDAPVARAVNILIEYAVKSRASDIHIEPRENFVQVRYRVDGILRDTMTLPKELMAPIISRIKILANLRIDEHRIPQDGRIKIKIAGQSISIRISTLPIMDGEKIVMRLLDESTRPLTLEELGYKGQTLITVERSLKKPHGMLLVTGPTGSGKSTTLYSVVSIMNNIGVNISTVEDPVEYHIQGVNQTQVNPKVGMTFASGLRALLRQDPDIIMVGEIRDAETAEIAVNSALTGHIVLSTLHTNNAAGCLPRLLDMGVEPFLIASTVNAVIGQRLVRKICPYCLETYTPESNVIESLINNFGLREEFLINPENQSESIKKSPEREGSNALNQKNKETDEIELKNKIFLSQEELEKPPKKIKSGKPHLTLYRGKGCNKCDNSGYLGRLGIYEILEVNDDLGKLIISHASTEEIEHLAIKNGMVTMQQDGFLKALEGLTTVEEVLRVTRG